MKNIVYFCLDKTLVAEACTFIGLDIEIRLFVFSDIDYVKFSNTIRFADDLWIV